MESPAITETLKSFDIDEKLKFDVSKSKYGVCGVLCEERKLRDKEETFWALYFLSPTQWRKLQNFTRVIDECLLNKDYSREFIISNNGQKLIGLAAYNNDQFVRFIVISDNGEIDSKKSMTIKADAWRKLNTHSSSITSLLPEKKRYFSDETIRKQNQEARVCPRYRYICSGKHGQVVGAWYLLRCQAVGNMNNNKENVSNAQIQKQHVEMPSNDDILKRCFLHMLCQRIHEISFINQSSQGCEGCEIDHPSQTQHMGTGGCLEMLDVNEDHESAFELLSDDDVYAVYREIQKHLGLHEDITKTWLQMNVYALRKSDLSNDIKAYHNYSDGESDVDYDINISLSTAIEYFRTKDSSV